MPSYDESIPVFIESTNSLKNQVFAFNCTNFPFSILSVFYILTVITDLYKQNLSFLINAFRRNIFSTNSSYKCYDSRNPADNL